MEPHTQSQLPKTLLSGAAMALVAGMLMGTAMKPDLNIAERPEGPQILAGWSAERSTGPFDDGPTLASYKGQVPDYVVGTDWKKEIAWQADEPIDVTPVDVAESEPPPAPVTYTRAVFQDDQPAPVTYPSMSGGASYNAETPPPPPPPKAQEPKRTFGIDVPPEATGDTTIATHIDGA